MQLSQIFTSAAISNFSSAGVRAVFWKLAAQCTQSIKLYRLCSQLKHTFAFVTLAALCSHFFCTMHKKKLDLKVLQGSGGVSVDSGSCFRLSEALDWV